ncbi:hypothetical protein KJ590_03745, partial [Patescibacteria group bacterium]|nr:hypothetical protein [Patescibacteria group bacterium]
NSTDAFNKLRFLRFANGKKKPELQDLQKTLAAIKNLPLPERCQLNLMLSAGKPWPQIAINKSTKTGHSPLTEIRKD